MFKSGIQWAAIHDVVSDGDGKLWLVALSAILVFAMIYFRTLNKNSEKLIKVLGVSIQKITRTSKEIERKSFHISGLVVPILYQILLKHYHWTQSKYAKFCWLSTLLIWLIDGLRVAVPSLHVYFPYNVLNRILREEEKAQLSGSAYFSLGCSITITFFSQPVAILAIVWLIVGDMFAALFGVFYGGDICNLRMGRCGKKSVEGSVAMFIVCFIVGMIAFNDVYLSEYAVGTGALVATLVELYEPLYTNDNLTIPVFSALALQWGFDRIKQC